MAYYPSYYQPQPYPYQDQLTQLRNPMPNQIPPQMPGNRPDQTGLNWVQGESGAKSWFVAPGATVLLMDSEDQRFYLKSADMNGVPGMRTFSYTEIGAQGPATLPAAQGFVTVDAFETFKKDVLRQLDDLSRPVQAPASRGKSKEE